MQVLRFMAGDLRFNFVGFAALSPMIDSDFLLTAIITRYHHRTTMW
jgi:hypothetical protein